MYSLFVGQVLYTVKQKKGTLVSKHTLILIPQALVSFKKYRGIYFLNETSACALYPWLTGQCLLPY